MLQSHFSLDISARYFEIAPRSRLSRHERVWCGEIALRSRRGVDISTRYFAISPRWWLSRRDLADLGAISARLPRSHRGLLFSARYFEISPRSWLSRRDLADLGEIAAISPRSRSNFYKGSYKDHKQPWSEPNACVAMIVVSGFNTFQKSFVMWNNHRQVEGYMKQNISIKKAMSQQFAYNKVILSKSVLTQ